MKHGKRLRKIGAYSSSETGTGIEGLVPMAIASPMGVCARGRLCERTRRAVRQRGDEVGQGRRAPWRHSEPWNRQTVLFIHVLSASLVISFIPFFFFLSDSSLITWIALEAKITQPAENPVPLPSPVADQRFARDRSSNSKALDAFLKTEPL